MKANKQIEKNQTFSGDDAAAIGSRMRKARNFKGLTLNELAQKIDYSFSHYSKVESGNNQFHIRLVERFAEETGIAVKWLLTGEGEMEETTVALKEKQSSSEKNVLQPTHAITDIARIVGDEKAADAVANLVATLGITKARAWQAVIEMEMEKQKSNKK